MRFPEAIHQSEDALFNMQMLEYVKSVDFLHETLTTYRVWGMSSFQRFHADLPQQMEQVNQQFLTFGKVHHKGDFYWNAYEVWLMETYIRLLKRYFYHPNNPQSEAEKKRAWKALLTTCPSLKQLRPRKLEEDVPVAQVVSAAAVFPAVLPLLRAQSARDGMAFADGQILTKRVLRGKLGEQTRASVKH